MKKIILIALVAIVLIGCGDKEDDPPLTLDPTVVTFVSLGVPGTTINFSPDAPLPTSVTYKLRDDQNHEWELGKNGFDGKVNADPYSASAEITFTQTFYLKGNEITNSGSKRVVKINFIIFPSNQFATLISDTGSVTIQYP